MSVTQRHWLLLVTVVALGVAVAAALGLDISIASAHYTGSGHWHFIGGVPGGEEWCYRWFNWWGQATSTVRCY